LNVVRQIALFITRRAQRSGKLYVNATVFGN